MSRPLVIIPACNESSDIESVVAGARAAAPHFDVVVIDDGSSDGTGAAARRAGARVIRHAANLGYGVALQTGYRVAVRARCPVAVQIDGDGQHDPADIPRLAAPVLEGRADAVYGVRFHGRSSYRMPLFRRLGSAWFSFLLRLLTGERSADPTTGMQALSLDILELYDSGVFPNDYPDADMIVLLRRNGFRRLEVPVSMRERGSRKSMHHGPAVAYYVYKMTLAMLMNRIRGRERRAS